MGDDHNGQIGLLSPAGPPEEDLAGNRPAVIRTGGVPVGSYTGTWFGDDGLTLTSHNGAAELRRDESKLQAFRDAYAGGYRRFQVDVLPLEDALLSWHTLFGRRRAWERMTRAELPTDADGFPTLHELLTDEVLRDCSWNIEMKSKRGLTQLRNLLTRLEADGRDLSTIMISSPFRPSVLTDVAARFPNVALAAPMVHGGVFGVRMLGTRRAQPSPGRPYDCQQVYHPFVRQRRERDDDRPPRQAWNLTSRRALDRILDAGGHAIVDARRLKLRGAVRAVAGRLRPDKVEVLALGGGGWRGAFGAIGTLMYLQRTRRDGAPEGSSRWDDVLEVIGISGGSFAVAALAEDAPAHAPGDVGSNGGVARGATSELTARLRDLLANLEGAGRTMAKATAAVVAAIVVTVGLVVGGFALAMLRHPLWGLLLMGPALVGASLAIRAVVMLRWRRVLRSVYGRATMRDETADPTDDDRRYALGATGLHDGRLYCFTTHAPDGEPWRATDRSRPVPLRGWPLADAVARATSLPGVGQLGFRRILLPGCGHEAGGHDKTCPRVPDRLVDGGVSGIFGRSMLRAQASTVDANGQSSEPVDVLVIDAGRSLKPNDTAAARHRLSRAGERLSAVVLLARWLMVTLDVGYRGELRGVSDGNVIDGHRYWLVRLAEEEADLVAPLDPEPDVDADEWLSTTRGRDLQRLYALRDQVHRFSLMRANELNANRSMAAAIAACALEMEQEPDIEAHLRAIDDELGRNGRLVQAWTDVPLL